MTPDDATALELFIKDHDTRFEPTARLGGEGATVALKEPRNGTQLEPVRSVEEYGARFIEARDPGPTIRGAWERWVAQRCEASGQ